ncbi:MAG: DUF11 domain-containing protein, partial [Anaerolineales bacterium]|nr:DUF11 domain-containing protein [Anaerolineales bacterium]
MIENHRRLAFPLLAILLCGAMLVSVWSVLSAPIQLDDTIPDSIVHVAITSQGFDPEIITTTIGTTIIWTNQTTETVTLIGGNQFPIFLPIVKAGQNTGQPGNVAFPEMDTMGNWNSGPIDPGETYSRAFTAADQYPYHLESDPDVAGQINVIGPSVDLAINKSSALTSLSPGDTVTYTLTFSNSGTITATGVVITDTLPAHSVLNIAGSSPGWTQIGNSNIYFIEVGEVPVGSVRNITANVDISSSVPASLDSITNSVVIGDDHSYGADLMPGDNSDELTLLLEAAPDLAIRKSDNNALAIPGERITYTVRYENVGNQGATGIVITETLPADSTFEPLGSSPNWQQVGSSNVFTAGVDSLSAFSTGIFTLVVTLPDPIPQGTLAFTNTVAISDDHTNGADPTVQNNTFSVATPITTGPTSVCGPISSDQIWHRSAGPYLVTCDVVVNDGIILTIEAGTVVKVGQSGDILLNGQLLAQGTEVSPVHITSSRDDSVGGDSNGDGNATTPAPGDWGYIRLGDGGSMTLDHTHIHYSAGPATIYSNQNAAITLRDSSITDVSGRGIMVDSGASSPPAFTAQIHFEGSSITNALGGIEMTAGSD